MPSHYAPCGVICELFCKDYKKRCSGCKETKGKPWFLKFTKFESCPIYSCVTSKRLAHCAECEEFPCETFLSWFNPRVGFFRSSLARVGSLYLRKRVGTRKWKKIVEKYTKCK